MAKSAPKSNVLQFDKKQLLSLKTRAMRSGAWFRALKRIDRVLIDLTIKVVVSIRSSRLAKSIQALANKLEYVMKSGFSRRAQEIGFSLAQKISSVGQRIGNASSISWALDSSFAFFLAMMHINNNSQTCK